MRKGYGDRAERGQAGGMTKGGRVASTGAWPGLMGLVLLLAPVPAGTADAGEPDVWRFQCIVGQPATEQVCTTEFSTSADGRDFLIYFVHNKDSRVPLVVSGDDQEFIETIIKVDKKDAVGADRCEVGLCYYGLEKSALLLKQFRRGRRARVTIAAEGSEVILDKSISLRGFSAAFAEFGS